SAVISCKERCGLADSGKRLIGNLSKGYQQRVGLAQAIIHNPPVIILDEPTSGLDPNQLIEIRDLIILMRADHSILLSTHILAEAESLCDRILILHQGRVVADKPLAELTSAGPLEQVFHSLTRSEQPR